MAYKQVQFVAYDINTMAGPGGYLGLPIAAQDIEARCALMLRAMETARDNLPVVSPPPAAGEVLKVFMAPEFFFRGATGAYDLNTTSALVAALQALAADQNGGWDDWVFCYGTIIGADDPDPNVPRTIYNYALIQEGGVASAGPDGARIVHKELMSGIDFITASADPTHVLLGQVQPLPPGPVGPGRETQKVNYDGAGIFTLRGITWSGDICLDHMVGRMPRSPQLPGDQVVQIQLVPSAGTPKNAYPTIAAPGGYVFRVDGGGFGSDVLQVGAAPVAPLGRIAINGNPVPVGPASPPLPPVPIASLYQAGPGVIVFFPPQTVPPASTVPGLPMILPPWDPTDAYRFTFTLCYDQNNQFTTAMMLPQRLPIDIFGGHDYFLPMLMRTVDADGYLVEIDITLRAGADYNVAVWCVINMRGFQFEGVALQFDLNLATGRMPETIW